MDPEAYDTTVPRRGTVVVDKLIAAKQWTEWYKYCQGKQGACALSFNMLLVSGWFRALAIQYYGDMLRKLLESTRSATNDTRVRACAHHTNTTIETQTEGAHVRPALPTKMTSVERLAHRWRSRSICSRGGIALCCWRPQ